MNYRKEQVKPRLGWDKSLFPFTRKGKKLFHVPKALPSQGISSARLTATVKEGGTLVPPRPFLKTDA